MMKTDIEIVPYGEIFSALPKERWRTISHRGRVPEISSDWIKSLRRPVFVSYSQDIDENLVEIFLKAANQDARLLILNESLSADSLLSRMVKMRIRSAQRFYVADYFGCGKTHVMDAVWPLLKRIASTAESKDSTEQILDAKMEDGRLHVVSLNFDRLDVSLSEIPQFNNIDVSKVQQFEIDEDGAFLYWPELDLHLGWRQLQHLVNPELALKASQKNEAFNKQYGRAVRKLREELKLQSTDITGLSEKQLSRIEKGQCRVTSNAIEALSKAHNLNPNEYMKKLAEALEPSSKDKQNKVG